MQAPAQQVQWIPIEEIIQEQPETSQGDMVQVRRREDGRYTLLSGGERLRHMREAGRLCVDAVTSPSENADERISRLLDQQVRGSIHYLDEAQALRELLEVCSMQRLSERVGRTPQTISRKLRLLDLAPQAQQLIRQYDVCESCARQVLRLPGQQGRLQVLKRVAEGRLSVKETGKLVDEVLSRMPVPMTGDRRMKPVMRDYRLYVNAIRGIVEQMEEAGLEARMQVNAGRHVAEVRITVPMFALRAR